jgi:hypothetical protein
VEVVVGSSELVVGCCELVVAGEWMAWPAGVS